MAISTKKGASDNSLVELLGQLPYVIYRELNREIRTDLKLVGKASHYRNCVLRDNWKLGDTHVACVQVLIKHLNLPLAFFTERDPAMIKEYILTSIHYLTTPVE